MNRSFRLCHPSVIALVVAGTMILACQPAPDAAEETLEPAATGDPAVASETGQIQLLDADLAAESELEALSGITDDAVKAILEGRPFRDALELAAALAPHLDDVAREELYRSLWVPLDLNRASRAEILLIPGVGERMAHEFEEYRPYDAMARFRREIGKYVDDAEVERLAAYVFVPLDIDTASAEELLAIPGVGERMRHELEEYRPYQGVEHFRREIGKYVDDAELARLERYFVFP